LTHDKITFIDLKDPHILYCTLQIVIIMICYFSNNKITSYFKTSPQAQASDFAEASTGQAALDRGGQSS